MQIAKIVRLNGPIRLCLIDTPPCRPRQPVNEFNRQKQNKAKHSLNLPKKSTEIKIETPRTL